MRLRPWQTQIGSGRLLALTRRLFPQIPKLPWQEIRVSATSSSCHTRPKVYIRPQSSRQHPISTLRKPRPSGRSRKACRKYIPSCRNRATTRNSSGHLTWPCAGSEPPMKSKRPCSCYRPRMISRGLCIIDVLIYLIINIIAEPKSLGLLCRNIPGSSSWASLQVECPLMMVLYCWEHFDALTRPVQWVSAAHRKLAVSWWNSR